MIRWTLLKLMSAHDWVRWKLGLSSRRGYLEAQRLEEQWQRRRRMYREMDTFMLSPPKEPEVTVEDISTPKDLEERIVRMRMTIPLPITRVILTQDELSQLQEDPVWSAPPRKQRDD